MKNHPLSLCVLIIAGWFPLCGLSNSDTIEVKRADKLHSKHHKNYQTDTNKENNKDNKDKPLDLSVPFKEDENNKDQSPLPDDEEQNQKNNLFNSDPKNTPHSPLQLKGTWLMLQEPELEKRKSVDGAGIIINVKP